MPIELYNASKESRIEFAYLRKKDLCPIRHVRICEETGEEVPFEEIVRGYEYEKGDYVVLTDEDFRSASVEKTETIEIIQFIRAEEVDYMLMEKPYYVTPARGADKLYVLLKEALKKSGKVGLARFVFKTREHIGIIHPQDDMLILQQMRYRENIQDPSDLDIPRIAEFSKQELDMAVRFIDELTLPFESEDFHDTYNAELMRLIEAKRQGRRIRKAHAEKRRFTATTDIMTQLKESLELARKDR